MVRRLVRVNFLLLRVWNINELMVSVGIQGYSAFVCPFCRNVVVSGGGYRHFTSHQVPPSALTKMVSYTVVMDVNESRIRGLAVLLNAYLASVGFRLMMGRRILETLASLIRENPKVFADVFTQVMPLASAIIPISDDAAVYVFKFGNYMTLYAGYDTKTNSIAMIERDGKVLYTRGTNADSLAKIAYAIMNERRELGRRLKHRITNQ